LRFPAPCETFLARDAGSAKDPGILTERGAEGRQRFTNPNTAESPLPAGPSELLCPVERGSDDEAMKRRDKGKTLIRRLRVCERTFAKDRRSS